MEGLDFTYDEASCWIEKVGHDSRCEPHEASREEVLLWQQVQLLEACLDLHRPEKVKALVDLLRAVPPDTNRIFVSPQDYALLRAHASDVFQVVTWPEQVRQHILGRFTRRVEGEQQTTWMVVRSDVPLGTFQFDEVT